MHCGSIRFIYWRMSLQGLFNDNEIFLEEQLWCYSNHCWDGKDGTYFSFQKANVIRRREFERACDEATV